MQEQVNEKTIALSVKSTKITARLLAKAMQAFLQKAKQPQKTRQGKQSLQSLSKQGASLENAEITGDDIGKFTQTARKYNIDFALKRDNSKTPPNWIVFFKAKDSATVEIAFKEFSQNILKQKSRKTSMLAQLEIFKKIAKAIVPTKKRSRGER